MASKNILPIALLGAGVVAIVAMGGKKKRGSAGGNGAAAGSGWVAPNVYSKKLASVGEVGTALDRAFAGNFKSAIQVTVIGPSRAAVTQSIMRRAPANPSTFFAVMDPSLIPETRDDINPLEVTVFKGIMEYGDTVAEGITPQQFEGALDDMIRFAKALEKASIETLPSSTSYIDIPQGSPPPPKPKPKPKPKPQPTEPVTPPPPQPSEPVTPSQPAVQTPGVYQRGANLFEIEGNYYDLVTGGQMSVQEADVLRRPSVTIVSDPSGSWPTELVMYFAGIHPDVTFVLASVIDTPDFTPGLVLSSSNLKKVGQSFNWISQGANAIGSAVNQL